MMIVTAPQPTLNLRVRSIDSGNCRVYYSCRERPRSLYCMQLTNSAGDFDLLICSKDGEPECPVNLTYVATIEAPRGEDDRIEAELRAFLAKHPRGA